MGWSNAPDVRAKDEEGDAGRLLVEFGEIDMNAHEGDQPPNGSRLSCGRTARGRKELEPQTRRLASEATQFFPQERPAASSAC